VVARQVHTGETLDISDAPIDCTDLTGVAHPENSVVVWSQLTDGIYQLFEGSLLGSSPRQITYGFSSAINPALTVDITGALCLAYQTSDKHGHFNIYLQRKVRGQWEDPVLVSNTSGNNWCPSIATCSDGKLAIAWDGYASGSYDIYLRFIDPRMSLGPTMRLTADDFFQANVTLSPAPDGAVWIAWNRGTPNWGKDNGLYPTTSISEYNFLHTRRSLEIRRAFPSRILPVYPPLQEFLDSALPGLLYERPRLYSAPDGPLYLAFRFNPGALDGHWHRNEKRWQAILTCYNGDKWVECAELDGAYGLSTGAISLVQSFQGTVFAAASGEGGNARAVELETKTSLYKLDQMGIRMKLTDPSVEGPIFSLPKLVPTHTFHSIEHKGQRFHLYFGDLHRHTELSFCRTSIEGSLEEAYRSTRDAAAMDFAMTADHDFQEQAPDMWAETMKAADRFYIPGHFTTFFGYEWIGGKDNRRHRNIVSTVRPPVPPFDYGIDGHRNIRDTWATLQPGKAITIPHHTACDMSLIWGKDSGEDSDSVLEPLVEIFQGNRASSEYPHCPTLCNAYYYSGKHRSFDIKGGFVSDALKQGIRMGFIASSDHGSTHRSYACLYAKENTREGLMEAMLARRTYAATDRIICEFFIGDAMMGEEIKSQGSLNVLIRFLGTNGIKEVTLLRDSIPFRTWSPSGKETEITMTLYDHEACRHYFYVRMIQYDSNLAWSSPIWVD